MPLIPRTPPLVGHPRRETTKTKNASLPKNQFDSGRIIDPSNINQKIDKTVKKKYPSESIIISKERQKTVLRSKSISFLCENGYSREEAVKIVKIIDDRAIHYNSDTNPEFILLVADAFRVGQMSAHLAAESEQRNHSPVTSKPDLTLPATAPELYVGNRGGKKGGENIVAFLRRVWMSWIEAGVLTRPDLRRLDPKADIAITNWVAKKPWPDDLLIPSKADVTEKLADSAIIPEDIAQVIRAKRALQERRNYALRN